MPGFNVLKYFRDGLKLGQNLEIQLFLPPGDVFPRHVQAVLCIKSRDDIGYGHASPGIEELFSEFAVPFR
jgi:hypothetical protein